MKAIELPPAKVLRDCLRYERKTGKLYWRKRPRKYFAGVDRSGNWNTKFADKEAFVTVSSRGYLIGSLFGVRYKASRIIWKMITGQEPPEAIDHKDRVTSNNKWGNLRPATDSQNLANRNLPHSASGYAGVRKDRQGKWAARIMKNYKYIHIGTFDTKEEAAMARRAVAVELFGEFAPCN